MTLVDELRQVFGTETFDASAVVSRARVMPALAEAIENEIPRARYRAGPCTGMISRRAVRMALRRHAGIRVVSRDDWKFKIEEKEA